MTRDKLLKKLQHGTVVLTGKRETHAGYALSLEGLARFKDTSEWIATRKADGSYRKQYYVSGVLFAK